MPVFSSSKKNILSFIAEQEFWLFDAEKGNRAKFQMSVTGLW